MYEVDENGCWIWTGAQTSNKYGQTKTGERAHRWAYRQAHPEHSLLLAKNPRVVIRHSCDVKLCVNPAHLFIGTQRENVQDCLDRDRKAYGTRMSTAKLDDEKARDIFRRAHNGERMHVLAAAFGVDRRLVRGVRDGKRWRRAAADMQSGITLRRSDQKDGILRTLAIDRLLLAYITEENL